MRYRPGMQPGGDQTGEVGHVDHQVGAHLVGDLAETGEVQMARIGRPTRNDHLGPMLAGASATSSMSIR